MEEFLFLGYVFVCTLLPLPIVCAIRRAADRRSGIARSRAAWLGLLAFAAYAAGVFYFTGAGALCNVRQYGMGPEVVRFSLAPFSAPSFDAAAYLLNVALFLPLGFLLPLLWPAYNRFFRVLLFGAAFSLTIELSQMLNIRSTDIDDLLLNTLGAVLGFLLFRLFRRAFRRERGDAAGGAGEPVLCLAAMYISYFVFFNERGLAKLLYGF